MWRPLIEGEPNPILRDPELVGESVTLRVFGNDRYQVIARDNPEGMTWLSIKRHDRGTFIPWRHLQQMKNEVCGPEREGLELYPAESRLADTANEYHLWVLPEGMTIPLGFGEGKVTTDEQAARFTADEGHRGRQEPWEPGLTTGRNEATPYVDADDERQIDRFRPPAE